MDWCRGATTIGGALVLAVGAVAAAPSACGDESREAAVASEAHATLFSPLVTDPKEPHFFASILGMDVDGTGQSVTIGSAGFGDEFGVWGRQAVRGGWQIGLQAGVMAQFLLERGSSYPLINADYVVGVPLTWRRDRVSARVRVYHQSSHLGDEYLLQNPGVQRIDVSFEELEGIAALDVANGRGRVYAGAGVLLHTSQVMERDKLLAGVEWRGRYHRWSSARQGLATRLVTGVQVKLLQELEWKADLRTVFGVEVARGPAGRAAGILAEYYHGSVPYGQFFHDREDHIGIGVHLGL